MSSEHFPGLGVFGRAHRQPSGPSLARRNSGGQILAPILSTNNIVVTETPLEKRPSTTQTLIFTSLQVNHLLPKLTLSWYNFTAPGTDHLEPPEEKATHPCSLSSDSNSPGWERPAPPIHQSWRPLANSSDLPSPVMLALNELEPEKRYIWAWQGGQPAWGAGCVSPHTRNLGHA